MDSYLSTQRSTIFQHVGVLIYVFDVESREMDKDIVYYRDCLDALKKFSPEAVVFLLVHKMDLVRSAKKGILEKRTKELQEASGDVGITVFGTSIYDESLYKVCFCFVYRALVGMYLLCVKAWSRIVHTLIPNAAILSKHLTTFAGACSATEVILFERTTFLVIATSQRIQGPPSLKQQSENSSSSDLTAADRANMEEFDPHQLQPTRYERTSELIKAFKHACMRSREEFRCLDMELPEYTAVLDELTKNTYIMVIVHDPTIGMRRYCLFHYVPIS